MASIEMDIPALEGMDKRELHTQWQRHCSSQAPRYLSRDLLIRMIAYKIQERSHGGLKQSTKRKIRTLARQLERQGNKSFNPGISLKPGAKLVREWQGRAHTVIVLEDGFDYIGQRYGSLSQIAKKITGAHWSGPRFFGLKNQTTPLSSTPMRHE